MNKSPRRHRMAVILAALAACGALTRVTASVASQPEFSSWWGTDCEYFHPDESRRDVVDEHGFVAFRQFPVTPDSIDGARRTISPFNRGITFQMNGQRFTAPWQAKGAAQGATPRIRVVVEPLGAYNSAVAMTIIIDGRVLGDGVSGNMELNCWRPLEDLFEKYLPGSVSGSPPRPNFPLHDMSGNVIPEPAKESEKPR